MPNSRSLKLNLESIDKKKIIDACAEQVKESLKLMIKEASFEKDVLHQQEVEALRMQNIELKSSQEFICLKYDNLKAEYDRLTLAQQQHNKINAKQTSMSQVAESDTSKIDVIEQYGRWQNLKFKGVPVTENEKVINTFCLFLFYLPFLSSIHEKVNCIAILWTGSPHSLGSCLFRGLWATCLPHKGGGIPLSALPKNTTSELAGLFSTTSHKCRAPSREAVDTIF